MTKMQTYWIERMESASLLAIKARTAQHRKVYLELVEHYASLAALPRSGKAGVPDIKIPVLDRAA